jgi:glucosamine--fructose-6-phosphate aminotransferase (isomerizing)
LNIEGYDSAGVMLYDDENLKLCKTKGKVSDAGRKLLQELQQTGHKE